MIEIKELNKNYDSDPAIRDLSLTIQEHKVFGMVGMNGAGKTTLLRLMSGVLMPDGGEVLIDGESVHKKPSVREKLLFIPDDLYFFGGSKPGDMMRYYAAVYPTFSKERFFSLVRTFGLDLNRKISGYSKGMKKQLSFILGLCAGTKYLFCDETFDGLDPLMRQVTKELLLKDMKERDLTPVMTSHNLREMEDICDHMGILHKGGILLSKDRGDIRTDIQKVQCLFRDEESQKRAEEQLDIVIAKEQGEIKIYTVRQTEEDATEILKRVRPYYFEFIPLSLEEFFISETEGVGYDIRTIIGE